MASNGNGSTAAARELQAARFTGFPRTPLTPEEVELFEVVKSANPQYFKAIFDANLIMPRKRKGYSGGQNSDPFTNFSLMRMVLGFLFPNLSKPATYFFYISLKYLRLLVQTRGLEEELREGPKGEASTVAEQAALKSILETLRDMINYPALAYGDILQDIRGEVTYE